MLQKAVLAVQPLHCAAFQSSALPAVVSFALHCWAEVSFALHCLLACCSQSGGALQRSAVQRWLCLAVVCTLSMDKVHFLVYELMVETSCSVNLSARMELGLEPLAHPGVCAKHKPWTYSTQMGRYVRAQSTFESR